MRHVWLFVMVIGRSSIPFPVVFVGLEAVDRHVSNPIERGAVLYRVF